MPRRRRTGNHTHLSPSLVPSSQPARRPRTPEGPRVNAARGVGAGRARRRRRRGRRAAAARRRRTARTSCASRTPASSSRATTCRSAAGASARSRKITLTDDNQAEITITVEERLRAAARGTTAIDPRDLAVGHRQPLHRAHAGRRTPTRKLDDGATLADRQDDVDRRPRPALQHARPEDAQGAAERHPGLARRGTPAAARRPTRRRKYFNPALTRSRAAGQRGRRRPADAQRLPASTPPGRSTALAAAPRRPRRTSSPTRTRPRPRSPPRTRRSTRRSALLPGTLRKANTTFVNLRATLDDLDVLVAASKPATKDLAPFLRELRPLVQRRAPDDRRPAHARRTAAAPTTTSPTCCARRRALEQAAKPAFAHSITALQQGHAGAQVHPALHAGPRRLAARLRPGRGELRRQRPLRAHPADLQRLLVRPTTRPAARSRRSRPASASPACRPARSGAARAPPRRRPSDGSAPFRDTDGSLDCDPSLVPPGP